LIKFERIVMYRDVTVGYVGWEKTHQAPAE